MLNSKSLGKILFSLICLAVIALIVVIMLNEQKKMIISSNQNVEVAELLYQMRSSLAGSGCRENFSGLEKSEVKEKVSFLKFLTQFPNGDTGIIRSFYKGKEAEVVSQTGLTIKEYRISQQNNQNYLDIIFDRNYDGEIFVKKIPLYFTFFDNGRIKSCSLSPIKKIKDLWEVHNGTLFLTKYFKLKINESNSTQKLNLSGALYVSGAFENCDSHNVGTIAWNEISKELFLCHKNELISLTKSRQRGPVE